MKTLLIIALAILVIFALRKYIWNALVEISFQFFFIFVSGEKQQAFLRSCVDEFRRQGRDYPNKSLLSLQEMCADMCLEHSEPVHKSDFDNDEDYQITLEIQNEALSFWANALKDVEREIAHRKMANKM